MEASKEIEDIIDLSQTRDDTIQECSQKDGREGQVFTFPTQEVEIFNIKGWKGYANKFFDTDEEIQLSPKKKQDPHQLISNHGIFKHSRTDPNVNIELIFSITQLNEDILEEELLDRSNPLSPNFQKWLSFEDVGKLIRNELGLKAVLDWIGDHPRMKITWTSIRKEYMKVVAPIFVFESALNATFFNWRKLEYGSDTSSYSHMDRNGKTGMKDVIICDEYYVPSSLDSHITSIFNTVYLPMHSNIRRHIRSTSTKDVPKKDKGMRRKLQTISDVTVQFINNLYGITSNVGSARLNQSVFSTSSQYLSTIDLTTFQEKYNLPKQKSMNIGGFVIDYPCPTTSSAISCAEANLDMQYIMGLAQNTNTIYWYVGSSSPFVDWVTTMSNLRNPPEVNSVSWGVQEKWLTSNIINSFNTEAKKLGLMGATIVVATGDNGVAERDFNANVCQCLVDSSSSQNRWSSSVPWSGNGYFPNFPATSPWVLAVGATQGPETGGIERACQADLGGVITTGGGFSPKSSIPSWQSYHVSNYFKSLGVGQVPASGYNPNGRGIPDVSLIGTNYQTVIGGQIYAVAGTSASAPVMAAIISLLNAERLAIGKTSLGFINPLLYSVGNLSSAQGGFLNDITDGNNACCSNADYPSTATTCCASGFYAIKGWDPVTGLGTVNYQRMLSWALTYSPPTMKPTSLPTYRPGAPTPYPSLEPSEPPPTIVPSPVPSKTPTPMPSGEPSMLPTPMPSDVPTRFPSAPILYPSVFPSEPFFSILPSPFLPRTPASNTSSEAFILPTPMPYAILTMFPTAPTAYPSGNPSEKSLTIVPSPWSSSIPTAKPSSEPSMLPTTPPKKKTLMPLGTLTTGLPTASTFVPTSGEPSYMPSPSHSFQPTMFALSKTNVIIIALFIIMFVVLVLVVVYYAYKCSRCGSSSPKALVLTTLSASETFQNKYILAPNDSISAPISAPQPSQSSVTSQIEMFNSTGDVIVCMITKRIDPQAANDSS